MLVQIGFEKDVIKKFLFQLSKQVGIARLFEPEMEFSYVIVASFNDIFGDIDWGDKDNVVRQTRKIPSMVAKDKRITNAIANSDKKM